MSIEIDGIDTIASPTYKPEFPGSKTEPRAALCKFLFEFLRNNSIDID